MLAFLKVMELNEEEYEPNAGRTKKLSRAIIYMNPELFKSSSDTKLVEHQPIDHKSRSKSQGISSKIDMMNAATSVKTLKTGRTGLSCKICW